MTKVKICGNTNADDAKMAIELGADYLGFIFAESKRKVDIRSASEVIQALQGFHNFVGVFFNQPKNHVESIACELGIKTLQFHGDEPARYCDYFVDKGYDVIKSFRVKDAMSLKRIDEYNVTHFLFDAYVKGQAGGTGSTFDWNLIEDKPYVHEKLFLAGGLNVENLKGAIDAVHPFAVDVASGVESEPGIKDFELLKTFIKIAKEGTSHGAREDSIRS